MGYEDMVQFRELNGKKIVTSDAYTLGEVEGAEIDIKNWKITHLSVSLTNEATKDFGFKKPFMGSVKICLPINLIRAFGDIIALKKNLQVLKELPECKESR